MIKKKNELCSWVEGMVLELAMHICGARIAHATDRWWEPRAVATGPTQIHSLLSLRSAPYNCCFLRTIALYRSPTTRSSFPGAPRALLWWWVVVCSQKPRTRPRAVGCELEELAHPNSRSRHTTTKGPPQQRKKLEEQGDRIECSREKRNKEGKGRRVPTREGESQESPRAGRWTVQENIPERRHSIEKQNDERGRQAMDHGHVQIN